MDTIMIIRDSVATCVNKTTAICQPCINDASISWQDVVFQCILCITIFVIAFICIKGFFSWLNQRSLLKFKRDNEISDREWKLKSDLQDQLLCFLKDCAEIKRDEDGQELDKYNDGSKEYISMLKKMLNIPDSHD